MCHRAYHQAFLLVLLPLYQLQLHRVLLQGYPQLNHHLCQALFLLSFRLSHLQKCHHRYQHLNLQVNQLETHRVNLQEIQAHCRQASRLASHRNNQLHNLRVHRHVNLVEYLLVNLLINQVGVHRVNQVGSLLCDQQVNLVEYLLVNLLVNLPLNLQVNLQFSRLHNQQDNPL